MWDLLEPASIEKCRVDRFLASFIPLFLSFSSPNPAFFQKYFKGLSFQLSWGRKNNKCFHKSNYSLMSIYGLLLYSRIINVFHRKVPYICWHKYSLWQFLIYVILASWQMKAQKEGPDKIIFSSVLKKRKKIKYTYWAPTKCDAKDLSYLY